MFLVVLSCAVFSIRTAGAQSSAPPPPAPDTGFEPFSFVNYESPHVHPVDLTPNGDTLVAVNTADNSLMVFDVTGGSPTLVDTIAVGLDPVSVRARTNNEVWVVNHISDSVSIVDLNRGLVPETLATEDEPAAVGFAGTPHRAFVSASQVNRLNVFDLGNLNAAPVTVPILGEDPRMLAVSPDGQTVYAAIFESGNGTTIVRGGEVPGKMSDVVGRGDGPYGGTPIPPNDGDDYVPARNRDIPLVIKSMIVRKSDNGRWLDDNNGDWTRFVSGSQAGASDRVQGWDLPDRDVAAVDASSLQVEYQTRLMNLVMALDVNPVTGEILAVGTDATNEIRWEPNLEATFLRVNMANFTMGQAATIEDLNPHLGDYSVRSVAQSERNRSIGDPRGVAFTADGNQAYITGMGSNNVVVLDGNGNRMARIEVGQGPTGIVIDDASSRAYVMNKFDGSISVLNTGTRSEIGRVAFFDPTPADIKAGRPHLYDTHETSGLGQISCASCHVDARTDRLAWDLGDPSGEMTSRRASDGQVYNFNPIKGPMKTQTFQDIVGVPAMHHIGDKDGLGDFADSFRDLQGADGPLSNGDVADFEAMLATVHYPPNPNRNIDNSFSTQVEIQGPNGTVYAVADAVAGQQSFLTGNATSSHCSSCHNNARTRADIRKGPNNNFVPGQPLISENLRGFYDRMGMFRRSVDGSTSGFGFLPDASQASELINDDRDFPLGSQSGLHVHAFMLSIDGPDSGLPGFARDSHAGVGQQVTISPGSGSADMNRLSELVSIANSGNIGLVADGRYLGTRQGFTYLGGGRFQTDRLATQVTVDQLRTEASATDPITFTLVPIGSQYRLGVDGDTDGLLDGDERDAGQDPQNAGNNNWQLCAAENATCDFTGTGTVRFGADGEFVHGVFTDGVACSTAVFGDNLQGGSPRCWIGDTTIDDGPPISTTCTTISFATTPIRSFGGQDFGTAQIVDGGAGLRITDNGWKAVDLSHGINRDTVVAFDFRSTVQGEEHAIGFSDQLGGSADGQRFKLHGTQNNGTDVIQDFDTYGGDGSVERFVIPVGQFLTGSFSYLVLTADDDADGDGDSVFSNIVLYDEAGACESGGPEAADIGGVVTNANGSPRAGVKVDLFERAENGSRGQFLGFARTGNDGRYRFDELEGRCYVLTFAAPDGELFSNNSRWFQPSLCVEDGESRTDIDATLAAPVGSQGALTGSVTFVDGGPAEGVKAVLYRAAADGGRGAFVGPTFTGSDGVYRFDVDDGCYVIDLVALDDTSFAGRPFRQLADCVENGATVGGLDGVLSSATELASIGGTVTTTNGSPVAGVKIDLFRTTPNGARGQFLGFTRTGADGSFTFSVEPLCHTLTYIAPDGLTFNGSRWLQPTTCPEAGQVIDDLDATLN